jgi:hypothetical protein
MKIQTCLVPKDIINLYRKPNVKCQKDFGIEIHRLDLGVKNLRKIYRLAYGFASVVRCQKEILDFGKEIHRLDLEVTNPVLRIHEIFVWIEIRGSMPLTLTNGSSSGSCYFRH